MVRRGRFRPRDKRAALDKLAKHFGLYKRARQPGGHRGTTGEPQHDPRQVARAAVATLETPPAGRKR